MADGTFTRSLAGLFEPFPAEAISWRIGSTTKDKSKGMALAYIDARDVMDRLDQVCGPDGWQCDYTPMANGTTCCRIGINVHGEWVWKSNGGSATGDVDNEKEREMAEKGGYSDAFKRAAVLWGIGRYLYSLKTPWVELVQKGNSYVMADGERDKLDRAYAQFLRKNPPLQPVSDQTDAGLRETPSGPIAGAEAQPPASAPVPPPEKSAYRARKDGDWPRVTTRLRADMAKHKTRGAALIWWEHVREEDAEYKAMPASWRKMFRDEEFQPHLETLPDDDAPQTVWEDAE